MNKNLKNIINIYLFYKNFNSYLHKSNFKVVLQITNLFYDITIIIILNKKYF